MEFRAGTKRVLSGDDMSTTVEVEGDMDPETNAKLPKEAPLLDIVTTKKALLTEKNSDGMYVYKETLA
jgi:hypothetical protein